MKGKAVFLAMLLSVLLAGRAEAQRCLPKMRGIEMKAGMTGADGYWLGAALSSYNDRGGRLLAGSRTVELCKGRQQMGVRGGIPADQSSVQERECSRGTVHGRGRFLLQLPRECSRGTVHGGGRFPIQLPVGCEKDGVLLRGGVSPCRIRDGKLGRKNAV